MRVRGALCDLRYARCTPTGAPGSAWALGPAASVARLGAIVGCASKERCLLGWQVAPQAKEPEERVAWEARWTDVLGLRAQGPGGWPEIMEPEPRLRDAVLS